MTGEAVEPWGEPSASSSLNQDNSTYILNILLYSHR